MAVSLEKGSSRQIITSSGLFWTMVVILSLAIGVGSLFVPPIFVAGLLAVGVSMLIIIKYPFAGLIIYIVIFLMRPGELYPSLASLRIERIIGLVVLAFSLLAYKRNFGKLFFPTDLGSKMFFLFLLVQAMTYPFSYDQYATYDICIEYLKFVVLYLMIVHEVRTRERFSIFMGVFIIMIAFIAFLSFRDFYGGGAIYRMGITRAVGRTSAGDDANTLAVTLATTVPLVIVFLRAHRSLLLRLCCLPILLLFLVMIVNTGSRSGLVALLVGTGVLVYYSRYKLLAAIVAVVLMITGWFLMPEEKKQRYLTVFDEDRDANSISSGRVDIWKNGFQMILNRPILGVGADAFKAANGSGEFGPAQEMSPHSLYIQLPATTGLVGTVVWFIFAIYMWRRLAARRAPPSEDDEEAYEDYRWSRFIRMGMLATVTALLCAGFFGHSLYRYTWYIMGGMTVALNHVLETREAARLPKPESMPTQPASSMT